MQPLRQLPPSRTSAAVAFHLGVMAFIALILAIIQHCHGWPLTRVIVITPTAVREQSGLGFRFRVPGDLVGAQRSPTCRGSLSEDSKEQIPTTSGDRVKQGGAGLFNINNAGNLWFSSSDGSDPRTNGRRYVARFPINVPVGWWVGTFVLLIGSSLSWLMGPQCVPRFWQAAASWVRAIWRWFESESVASRCAVLFVVMVLVALKYPSRLTEPYFWAEDGLVFFADSFEHGWSSFWKPYQGYLHIAPRFIACLWKDAPIELLPALFNWSAWLFTGGIAAWMLWSRHELGRRWWLPLGLVLAPSSGEVFLSICNLHWLLAPALVVMATQAPPQRWQHWLKDVVLLVVAGLSGPELILLIPIWAIMAIDRRTKARFALTAVVILVCVVQGLTLLTHRGARLLRPSISELAELLWTGFIGPVVSGPQVSSVFPSATAGLGCVLLSLIALAIVRSESSREQTALLCSSLSGVIMLFIGTLFHSGVLARHTVFSAVQARYFCVPAVVLVWLSCQLVCQRDRLSKATGIVGLSLLCASAFSQFSGQTLAHDDRWRQQIEAVQESGSGTLVWPPGFKVQIDLRSHRILARDPEL